MKRAAAAFWFLLALAALPCLWWLLWYDPKLTQFGACVLATIPLILTMRDSVRAWKAAGK